MKIIMRQDVEKVGEAGTVQVVSDGFARNYLIPKGLAMLATPGELKVVAENQKVRDRKIARQEQQLQDLSDKIDGQRLEFVARVGDEGRLFGSVTGADIVERLSAVVGQEIDRRRLILDHPIRTTGEHNVVVHLVGKLRPQVTVVVVGERDPDAEPEVTATEAIADAVADAVDAATTDEVESEN